MADEYSKEREDFNLSLDIPYMLTWLLSVL